MAPSLTPQDQFMVEVMGAPASSFDTGGDVGGGANSTPTAGGANSSSPRLPDQIRPHDNPNAPLMPPEDATVTNVVDMPEYRDCYDAALQGVSGQSNDADKTTKKAHEIAEEAVKTQPTRFEEFKKKFDPVFIKEYGKFFLEAIQGTASQVTNLPQKIVSTAHAMSLKSLGLQEHEEERLDWKKAHLPQPAVADCKLGPAKGLGPNYMLCSTHDHIIDKTSNQVVARSLEEFKAGKIYSK